MLNRWNFLKPGFYEGIILDTREEYIGTLTEALAGRLAELANMSNDGARATRGWSTRSPPVG